MTLAGAIGVLAVLLSLLMSQGTSAVAGLGWQAGAESGPIDAPSSAELVEHPKAWDGRRIGFSGEAVGSVMARGDWAWVHLNDDAYAQTSVAAGGALSGYNSGQAVWAPAHLASQIRVCGDYGHQGDIVRVEGAFHAACSEHGGDMDIHADTLRVERHGREIVHPLQKGKVFWLIVLVPLVAGFWWLERRLSGKEASS